MPYELENRLVIGVASSAVFQSQGEEEYRKFHQENLYAPLIKPDPSMYQSMCEMWYLVSYSALALSGC
jgi:hypothetical protein